MNTTSEYDGNDFAATSRARQFRWASVLGLCLGLTAGAAIAGDLSVSLGGISASVGGGSVASAGASFGGVSAGATIGGGSVASASANVGSVAGGAKVGGADGLAAADTSVKGVGKLRANLLSARATRPPVVDPVPGTQPGTPAAFDDDNVPAMPVGQICNAIGGKSMNGFVVADRNGGMVGWVQGAEISKDGQIAGLTVLSTSNTCLGISGGSITVSGKQVITNMKPRG